MRKFKPKRCAQCNKLYTPTGSSSKYCSLSCRDRAYKQTGKFKEYRMRHAIKHNKVKHPGVGKGGAPHSGALNPAWKGGVTLTQKVRHQVKLTKKKCEACGKDLTNATHYEWCIHHKDHNKRNNKLQNLMLLCKRCHQIHHKCWKAFERATTIPQGSRVQEDSKRLAPTQ